MAEEKIDLRIGKTELIEIYPSDRTVNAEYIGQHEETHIFHIADGNKYVLMDKHWLRRENGLLTYTSVSSAGVNVISGDMLRGNKGLVGIIEIIDKYRGRKTE